VKRRTKHRLPANWGEKLDIADVEEILDGWRKAEQYWRWQDLMDTRCAAEQVKIVCKLITLWENILQRKHQHLPCMDLLREHRQTA
jgi:hypothetical protein